VNALGTMALKIIAVAHSSLEALPRSTTGQTSVLTNLDRQIAEFAGAQRFRVAGFLLDWHNWGLNSAPRYSNVLRVSGLGSNMAKKAKKAKKAKSAAKKSSHGRSTDWMRPPRRKVSKKKK